MFGFKARLFTWLPGFFQYMGYSILLVIGFVFIEAIWKVHAPIGIIAITAMLGTAYPLLFPWIPGHRFAVKGVWLGGITVSAMAFLTIASILRMEQFVLSVFFIFATAIFIGLSYTGNSAVSNYSQVRKEVATFLPANLILYMLSIAVFIIMEVPR